MSAMEFIDIKAQYKRYQVEIDRRIHAVLDHGHFVMGPEIAELETALAAYVGVKYAITVASGTDSLEIALRALDVGAGDEVITVPFTWISTAEVVGLVGAQPVFVDIDARSYNINIDLIEAAITPGPRPSCPSASSGRCRTTPASTPSLPNTTSPSLKTPPRASAPPKTADAAAA